MSPTTPSQPQSPKFMPGNHRSATVSDDIPKPPYVNSRILRDVKSHQTCKFNAMLKAMLKLCLPDNPESDLDQVLKRCLDAMIPLCNEDNELRSHLYDYCKTISIERNRYAPFVRLCNHALDVLGSKKLPNLQHLIPLISSDRILFHVSDSSVINCSHGHHKPDVVLVPFKAVQESAHEDHRHDLDSWKDVITKTATSPPHRAFSWENILLPLEFKTAKRKLNSPPKTYEIKETKHVRPIRTPSYGISDSWISTSSAGLTTASMSREGVSIEEATTSASKQSAGSKSTPSRASNKQKESGDRGSDSIIRPERHSTRLQGKTSASDSQYSAGIGTKRPLESGTTETSAKRQRIEKPRWTLHVNVRTALYGSEILSHSPFSASAMAMVIVDSVVYLWWYDRQGAIQTHGLDFIEDLPHFLVLLFALQRLPPKGWGKIDTPESQIHLEGQYGEMGVKLGKQLVEHWGIQGRATNILEVKALSLPPLIPSRLKEQLETQGMVVKLSWAQSKRVRESEIIQEISKRIKKLSEEDQDAIEGHIPDMITSNTFPAFETRNIRNDLGIAVEDIENRVLIMSVFRKLRPITELEGDEFWRAWWDCVLCHCVLWKIGIQHRDISAANLMYYRYKGQVMGVLNDYDLSTLVGPDYDDGPSGTVRTGTLPYMALDLLKSAASARHVEHQYKHDFEAFLWVLTWVTHRYQGGEEIPNPPFNSWIADHKRCRTTKAAYRMDLVTHQSDHQPTVSHASVWQSCGTVLMRTTFEILLNGEKLDTVNEYLGRMKKSIEGSGKDLSVNSFRKLFICPLQTE